MGHKYLCKQINTLPLQLTQELLVYSVDSSVQQTEALCLNPAGCCYLGPAPSD